MISLPIYISVSSAPSQLLQLLTCYCVEHTNQGTLQEFRVQKNVLHIFYRQHDFLSEPGVANEILENESKSCLAVA